MKNLEGKIVYLRPTGNTAKREANKIIKGTINKVARVYVTMTKEDSSRASKYRFKYMHLDDGYNGGYQVYETKQALDDRLFVEKSAAKIFEKYRYQRDYINLDIETIKQVAILLGVEL